MEKNLTKDMIVDANIRLKKHLPSITPLEKNDFYSEKINGEVYLKREDLQPVRSYKIRGALNFLLANLDDAKKKSVVCSSAGNHAQGFAYACNLLGIKGTIFMPVTTPKQKISKTKKFGNGAVEIRLIGDTFDDAVIASRAYEKESGSLYVHPFDDYTVMAGQGTMGIEIIDKMNFRNKRIDAVIIPIGGGGLISGIGTYIKSIDSSIQIIGAEPEEAASMKYALDNEKPLALDKISTFVDGVAVKKIGDKTFDIAKNVMDKLILVPEGAVCTTILELQNDNDKGIVAEPAGAVALTALKLEKEYFKGKTVVCILSGGNNDLRRLPEMEEKSLIYEGLKHYFIINFAQRPGALREFLDKILNPDDDIVRFEYLKKTNREFGPALVGIQLSKSENYKHLIENLEEKKVNYLDVTKDPLLSSYLI